MNPESQRRCATTNVVGFRWSRGQDWRALLACAVALLIAAACHSAHPSAITTADTRAMHDTVIALENATNLAVDRLDCAAAFENIGDQDPMFATGGRVFRTRAAFRQACEALVAPRTGAVFATDTVTAHTLSPDAVYVVREGIYTVNFKDGTSRKTYLIMTSLWARQNGRWKMVHLHESSRPFTP
jgi:ketosteroid isomerase-like protein